jgi:hypothetical protein
VVTQSVSTSGLAQTGGDIWWALDVALAAAAAGAVLVQLSRPKGRRLPGWVADILRTADEDSAPLLTDRWDPR